MHALKKNSIYFQSQFLQRAHDDVAERREEARMASELESIQRFNSVAFDSSKPIPFSRRESVQITPGYKFPTSFRNAGGVGVGRESITADIGTRALDEDFPENSPSSYSRRRSRGGGGKISFPLDEDLPAIPAKEYSFSSSRARGLVPKDDARRSSSSKAISVSNIKQHRYSMQVVESESDSREDSSWDDDEELYDPFDAVDADNGQRRASSAGGRGVQHVNQGMYRNSMLYRRESVAPAAAAAAGDGWLQQPKFSTAAGVSPRSMDDAAVQRRASQGERSLFSGRSLTSAPPNAASHSYAKSPSARVSFFMPSTPQGNGSTTNNKKISRSAVGDTNNHHVRRSSNQDSAGRRGVDQRRNDVDEEDYRGGGGLQFSPRSPVASGGGNPPLWSSSSHRKRESPDRIGSGRLSVSELADSSAAVREVRQRVQGQATRTRWDSTVRLMLRERAKSSSGILSLDDDDPDL
jgi:hypothetical protein